MSTQHISEREAALSLLGDLYAASVFCRDAYVRATHCIGNELLRAVFAQAREERARLADDLEEAIVELEGPVPFPPRSPVSFGAWVSDRDLVSWCDCADEILLDSYAEALRGQSPEHLEALLHAHVLILRAARERSLAWHAILAEAAPTGQRAIDVLLVGIGSQPDAERALSEHGLRVSIAAGVGEAIYRTLWQQPVVAVLPSDARAEFKDALIAAGLAEEALPRLLSAKSGMSVHEVIDAVLQLMPSQEAPLHGARVLVVEDDLDLRTALCSELVEQGFEVHEAKDGIEALEKLDRRGRNVVLLDLMMPRLSGVGFLKELERVSAAPPPVVIFSAYVEPVAKSYPNVAAVLRKTDGIDQLVDALRRSLRTLDPASARSEKAQ